MIRKSRKIRKNKQSNWAALEVFSAESFFIINKSLSRCCGPEKAMFISNLIEKYKYFKQRNMIKDDWFFQTHEQQMNETGITEYGIKSAKKFFKNLGILFLKKKGLPAKEHYKLDIFKLIDIIENFVTGLDPSNSVGLVPSDSGGHIYKDNIYKDNKKNILPTLEDFEKWYQSYPRKIGKAKAKQSWIKIQKLPAKEKPSISTLLKTVKEQSKTKQWQDKNYIPHPSTWLNQKRWDDEIEINNYPNKNNSNPIYDNEDFDNLSDYEQMEIYEKEYQAKNKIKFDPRNPNNNPELPHYQMSEMEKVYLEDSNHPFDDD